MSSFAPHRRRFLIRSGTALAAGWAVLAGLVPLGGCGGEDQAADTTPGRAKATIDAARAVADPCNDPASLSEEAKTTRATFKYEIRSADPAKLCQSCNFWQPPADGGPCGTCTLVKGPIHPLGSCMSWVEKVKA
ncbi:hypothetical protein KDM41_03955 [bacterium]|nr:hypothetical protein [bacterium]